MIMVKRDEMKGEVRLIMDSISYLVLQQDVGPSGQNKSGS